MNIRISICLGNAILALMLFSMPATGASGAGGGSPGGGGGANGGTTSTTSVSITDIASGTMQGLMSCLNWRVEGMCVFLQCSLYECHLEYSTRVGHFLPDAVVSSYRPVGQNPWTEARQIYGSMSEQAGQSILSSMSGGIGSLNINTGNQTNRSLESHSNMRFKECDVIGNPAVSSISSSSSDYICSSLASSFEPYLLSPMDAATWRWGLPEELYLSTWIPGLREIGNTFINTWGPVHPRIGWVVTAEDPKAGAVTAQRGADVATRSGQPHVYTEIGNGGLPNSESCSVVENAPMNSRWQMLSPVMTSACEVFGQNDALAPLSWADGKQKDENESYVWLLWRKYSCCTEIKGIYLFSIGGPVCTPSGMGYE